MEKVLKVKASTDFSVNELVNLVTVFSELHTDVQFSRKNYVVSAKSILGLMSLGVCIGDVFTITVKGEKHDVLKTLEVFKLLEDYFIEIDETAEKENRKCEKNAMLE